MDTVSYLAKALTLGFSAAIIPGAFQAYLINQAATHNWRRAALLSFAPLLSDGPIVLLAILVLGIVPAWVLSVLQIVGGAFILYLAFHSLQGLLKPLEANIKPPPSSFWAAVLINLLNPNVYIYWGTISGPLFIEGWKQAPLKGVLFLVCFYIIMIITSNILILLVNRLRTLGNRIQRILQFISAGLMAVMGVVQFIAGLSSLVS